MHSKLLNENDTAALLGVSPRTLQFWRWRGGGPVYAKIGRAVRYSEAELIRFIEAGLRQNTSVALGDAVVEG